MFFFGAFSGNLLYIVLVISYLAGCSAWVLRGTGNCPKEEMRTVAQSPTYVLDNNRLTENCHYFQQKGQIHADQAFQSVIGISAPYIPYFEALYVPTFLTVETQFHGSVLFARPPPLSLI